MFHKITILLFLTICACTSFHCSKEVRWLLEDARLHETRHTSYDAMIAERLHSIADYLDNGEVSESQLAFDILFIYKAKCSHQRNNNHWDKIWINRYDRIIKRLLEIYKLKYKDERRKH